MQMFKGCRREETAPHIFAVAQSAYHQLLTTRQDQTIALLGRSGSGKTTSCQHVLQYLVTIAAGSGKVYSGEEQNEDLKKHCCLVVHCYCEYEEAWPAFFCLCLYFKALNFGSLFPQHNILK